MEPLEQTQKTRQLNRESKLAMPFDPTGQFQEQEQYLAIERRSCLCLDHEPELINKVTALTQLSRITKTFELFIIKTSSRKLTYQRAGLSPQKCFNSAHLVQKSIELRPSGRYLVTKTTDLRSNARKALS